jgi:hypothetical protein
MKPFIKLVLYCIFVLICVATMKVNLLSGLLLVVFGTLSLLVIPEKK